MQRKYDFKNGTVMDAEQVDAEFNQLIGAVNNLEAADTSIKAAAQMKKITSDTGGVKLSVGATTGDILETLTAAGNGTHTFYAVGGSKNLPPSNLSIRGMAHMTGSGFGWVFAFDYNNKFFINYLNNGVWKGWQRVLTENEAQNKLWGDGVNGYFMSETHTVTPTKKLSDCRNGWILVWSDYDPGKANNYDFAYSYIPKFAAENYNGGNHLFAVARIPSSVVAKKIAVWNDKLVGTTDNDDAATGTNDVVLRYVLEW